MADDIDILCLYLAFYGYIYASTSNQSINVTNSRKIIASYLANSGVASRHRQHERNSSIYIPANITLLLEQYRGSSHFYSPGATPGVRFQDICYCFYYFPITIAVVIIHTIRSWTSNFEEGQQRRERMDMYDQWPLTPDRNTWPGILSSLAAIFKFHHPWWPFWVFVNVGGHLEFLSVCPEGVGRWRHQKNYNNNEKSKISRSHFTGWVGGGGGMAGQCAEKRTRWRHRIWSDFTQAWVLVGCFKVRRPFWSILQ